MKTVELSSNHWPAFCKYVEDSHTNTLLKAERAASNGEMETIVNDQPLQAFAWQHQDNTCSDALLVKVGLPGAKPADFQIVEPIRMILRNPTDAGRFSTLEIVAESGTVLFKFHPGLSPAPNGA